MLESLALALFDMYMHAEISLISLAILGCGKHGLPTKSQPGKDTALSQCLLTISVGPAVAVGHKPHEPEPQ